MPKYPEEGGVPGPPVQWEPTAPEEANTGYGHTAGEPELDVYYYHSDHLGSTAYITDRDANVSQFICYMPYGEVFAEERAVGKWESLYKFNGKELDEETGLYYVHARYRDPAHATWLNIDPLYLKFPHISGYNYCYSNPVRYIDPDGREIDDATLSVNDQHDIELQQKGDLLFNHVYAHLKKSKDTYRIVRGQTSLGQDGKPVKGQFMPDEKGGGTITFLTGTDIQSATMYEEFFHAYQHDNREGYDVGEFNREFEAKVATIIIGIENIHSAGTGFFEGMNEYQQKLITGEINITPENVTEGHFLNNYQKSANEYGAFNRLNDIGNKHYKSNTTVAPYSLQKMTQNAYEKSKVIK